MPLGFLCPQQSVRNARSSGVSPPAAQPVSATTTAIISFGPMERSRGSIASSTVRCVQRAVRDEDLSLVENPRS